MRSADLFVSTSRAERLDPTVVEAMAISRPVILPVSPSLQDLLAPGVDSEVVHSHDPGALATAILRLVRDPVRRRDLRRNALRTASQLDVTRIAERYREELEVLVIGGVRPPAYRPLPVTPARLLHS